MALTIKFYSVHDSKAEAFLPPFTAPTAGVAIRMWEQACNDPEHTFNQHAGDYTLFEIGEFDQDSGQVNGYAVLNNLGIALQYKTDDLEQYENKMREDMAARNRKTTLKLEAEGTS